MTRMTARQLAFQLLFLMDSRGISPDEAMELFFEEEHYGSLGEEDVIFQELPDEKQMDYIRSVADRVYEHREELDDVISRHAGNWKLNRISRTDLAILRCALCELKYLEDVPTATAVNEAVELAKRYDSPEAASFINGVLGAYLRAEQE